jgi:replication initiation protein RepC
MIRAKIEKALEAGLRGPWINLQGAFRELLESLPARSERAGGLESYLDRIRAFSASVEMAFDWPAETDVTQASVVEESPQETRNMIPTSLKNEAHILTTKQPNPVTSNRFETKHTASVVPKDRKAEPDEKPENIDLDISWSTHGTKRSSDIDIPLLMASCPHFAEMARSTQGFMRDWNDVHRAAAALRPMVGISEDAWSLANKVLGPAVAAASIALILDKTTDGEVKSPGGYLRGLVERAQIGELYLDRSFYGRLSGVGA